jgi:hypothetical protein
MKSGRQISRGLSASPINLFDYTVDQQTDLGAEIKDTTGNVFVYVKAGASALQVGKVQQSPAIVANHQNIAVASAVSAGQKKVTVTLGATAVAKNYYANGLLVINDADGQGHTYQIESNPSADASGSLVLTLSDELLVALTTSSEACLIPNPYNGVIINPTTATNKPCGVGITPIPANYFGWIQRKGNVACLNDGGTAVGLGLAPSGSVAGALATVAATTNQVGSALQAGVDTESRTVFIDM